MNSLRQHIRELQILENKAAEKAGMRFLLLDEEKLLKKKNKKYIGAYIGKLLEDISKEVIRAAVMGKKLGREVKSEEK